MGREKSRYTLAGHVAKSGTVDIVIESVSQADQSRLASIELAGTLRGGLISASGSFARGRPATLNWHKSSETSH